MRPKKSFNGCSVTAIPVRYAHVQPESRPNNAFALDGGAQI